MNFLSSEVSQVLTKGLTKYLINRYRVVLGKRYVDNVGSQNSLIYQPFNGFFTQTNNDKVFARS